MKAAVYNEPGPPEVFVYIDVPDPVIGDEQILVEVQAIGVQGGDLWYRSSAAPRSMPHVVGYQAAGIVRKIGASVEGFSAGQRVVSFMPNGAYAELAAVNPSTTWAIPDGMSTGQAAAVPVEFGTAHDVLFEFGQLSDSQSVLIQAGASGVGLAAVQLAKAAGATVLTTASRPERIDRLLAIGADHGINYMTEDVPARVRELTDDHGVDLAVDSVGGSALADCIEAVAYRGTVVFLGSVSRDATPPIVLPLMFKNARLQGVLFGAEMAADPERTHELVETLLNRVSNGDLEAVLDREFPLSEAAAAHRYIEERRAFGRVLLIP